VARERASSDAVRFAFTAFREAALGVLRGASDVSRFALLVFLSGRRFWRRRAGGREAPAARRATPRKAPEGRVQATLEIDGTASQSVTSYVVSEPGV
jgi:hypothetical protein